MDRSLLPHLPVVLAVARRRSFAAAAAELGMGASAVSHAVRLVERRVGLPLFTRTTRSVNLTEAGIAFTGKLQSGLELIEQAVDELNAERGVVRGLLRLNASRVAQAMLLGPLIARAAEQYPELTIEVTADEGLTDIVAAGFDAGVRLGEMIAVDMIAVRLSPPFRAIMVASPSYLRARPEPARLADLADLADHNCIGYRLVTARSLYAWDVEEDGRPVSLQVAGSAVVTDPLFALQLAEAGIGIAYVFEPLVAAAIASGRLVEVLPTCAVEEPGLFLYFPRGASAAPKLRAFVDLAKTGAPAPRS